MAFLIITLICYIIVAVVRKTKIPNEWLPLISGVLGMILSAVAFYVVPSTVPDPAIGTTLFYGFICGLAATGSNQVLKQAVRFISNKYHIDITLPTVTTQSEEKEK